MMEGFEINMKKCGCIDFKFDVLFRNIEFIFFFFVIIVVKILVKVFKY